MSKHRVPYLRASTGLNNKFDPVRASYNPENGISDLTKAVNVNIDRTGRIDRRKGYTEIGSLQECHSFYHYGSCLYFVGSNRIQCYKGVGTPEESHWVGNARCSFEGIGDRVYFCNGTIKGYLIGSTYYPWEVAEYVGPDTRKTFSAPPIGHKLCLFRGRMYVAQNEVVWYSEALSYHEFDLVRNYILPGSNVRMIRGVSDGLYIGTDKDIKFYSGTSGQDFDVDTVSDYGVVEGTDVVVSGRLLKSVNQRVNLTRNVILVVTHEGVLLLGPGGYVEQLMDDKLDLPTSNLGSAAVINGKYIFSLEP